MITETRKQIIQLINPFMDKTLSFWCMVEYWNDIIYITEYNIDRKLWSLQNWDLLVEQNKYIQTENWDIFIYKYKIIGHYDITAVLKYIIEKLPIWVNFRFFNSWTIRLWDNSEYWEIKFKPLHLYTEQEDENLYELLKQLWIK